MSLIKVVGVDLAKLFFSIHDTDEHEKYKFRKNIKQNNLLVKIAKLPPCIIGKKACCVYTLLIKTQSKAEPQVLKACEAYCQHSAS
jgi:transposase